MAKAREHKLPLGQLLVLCLCRIAEPIALTSVFPYLPEMIESFGVEKNEVGKWAGITAGSFSVAQAFTGVPWGSAADILGRKPTLLLGLGVTMLATVMFGFSRSLAWAIFARCLAGASAGTIGIARTAVAEMVPWKELQPRAFSFMPMVWSVGSIVGPLFGGALAKPAEAFPGVFGGVRFFETFPFSLPNLIAGVMFFLGVTMGTLYFKETHPFLKYRRDYGIVLGRMFLYPFKPLNEKPESDSEEHTTPDSPLTKPAKTAKPVRLVEVFTVQSSLALLAYTLVAFHSIAFDQLLPVFLHQAPEDPADRALPFKFAGGFGLSHAQIGILLTCYAILGLFLQFAVFPFVAARFGVLRCLRVTTLYAPIPYLLMPFTVLFSTTESQRAAVLCVMGIKCVLCAFWFPCSIIMLTNSVPSPRMLGTLNGIATSISAIGRAVGPMSAGLLFTFGSKRGYMILPWFYLGLFAVLNYVSTWYMIDSDGLGEDSDDEDSSSIATESDEEQPLLTTRRTRTLSREYSTGDLHHH